MHPRRASSLLVAIASALVFATDSHAATITVGPPEAGGPGINDAFHRARPGDVIAVEPGTYEGGVWIDVSGAPGRPITLRPARALRSVVIAGGEEGLVIADRAHDLVIEGLEIRDTHDNNVHVQGGAHDIVLRDLFVHDAGPDGDGVKLNQCHDVTLERIECMHPGPRPDRPDGNPSQECVDMVDVTRGILRDSFLHDGGNLLAFVKGNSHDVVFERNVFAHQGAEAIDPCVGLGGSTDRELLRGARYEAEDIVFRNNVIAGCHAGGIGVYDARRVLIAFDTLVDAGPQPIEFRAGNAPAEESRDVRIVGVAIVDRAGAMQSPVVRLSHGITNLAATDVLVWNGGRDVPDRALLASDALVSPTATIANTDARSVLPHTRDAILAWVTAHPFGGIDAVARSRAQWLGDDANGHARPAGAALDIGAIEFTSTRAAPLVEWRWPSQLRFLADAIDGTGVRPLATLALASSVHGRSAIAGLAVLALAMFAAVTGWWRRRAA